MLGKLLKHEWKAVTKVMLPANLVLIAITIIGRIMISARIYESENQIIQFILGFSTAIYILCLLAVALLCTIFLGYRFYKTTYTDEGYLLHTLPVNTHEIISSKLIVGAAWSLITSLFLFASVILLVLGLVPANDLSAVMREISYGINHYIGSRFTAWCIFFVFMMIISTIYSILWLYAGISFGQLFPKHKVVGAFIGFAVIYFASQIVSLISMLIGGIAGQALAIDESVEAFISYMESVYLMSFGISVVFGVLFYVFTNYMMKKKLNLD